MNQPRKLYFSNVVKPGHGEVTVEEAYGKRLTPDEHQFFTDAIVKFEREMMDEARAEARENPDPNFRHKPDHAVIAETTRKNFLHKTSDPRKVHAALHAIAKDAAIHGEYYPEDVFQDIAAEVNAERDQKFAASQARTEDVRKGELRNAEIDRRIEDYQRAVRERSGTEPSRNQALCDLRKFEKEIAEYRDLNPEVSKEEAKALVRPTNDSFELMSDGGAPYKGQCKEQWYEDELTPRGQQQQQEREPELAIAAAMDDGRGM